MSLPCIVRDIWMRQNVSFVQSERICIIVFGHRYVSGFDIHNAYFNHLILMIYQHTVSVLEWVFQYMHISNAIVRTFAHIWHHSWWILRLGKQVCLILLCLSFVIFQRFSRILNSSISINDFIQNTWHEYDQSILNSLYYMNMTSLSRILYITYWYMKRKS